MIKPIAEWNSLQQSWGTRMESYNMQMLNSRTCKAISMTFPSNWNRQRINWWIHNSTYIFMQKLQWDREVEGKGRRPLRICNSPEAQYLAALKRVRILQEQRRKWGSSARSFLLPLTPPQQPHLTLIPREWDRSLERENGGNRRAHALKLQEKFIIVPVSAWNPFGVIISHHHQLLTKGMG